MSDIAIKAENVGKKYLLRHRFSQARRYVTLREVLTERIKRLWPFGPPPDASAQPSQEEFWALENASFEVRRGEVLGVIGRNGAGKSTLLKILSRITALTTGRIDIEGRIASLLEVGTGFHPELTGRENIFLNGAILGMTRQEIKSRFDEIVAFSEVEKFLDTPVKRYSSGMYVRLAFAVAAHLQPEVLIVDEVLAVGDTEFQKKCVGRMQSVSKNEGRTVLFVSHNLQTVRQLCDRVMLLEHGKIAYVGDPSEAISRYLNPDTSASTGSIELRDYPRQSPANGAHLESVGFWDEQGNRATRILSTRTLRVEFLFRSERALKQVDFAMAVTHSEGLRVFSEIYSDKSPKPDLARGEYVMSFSIPMHHLKLESYSLTIAIFEEGRACDQVDGLPLPESFNPDADPHHESQRWGVVRIPVNWSTITNFKEVASNA